MAKRTRYPKRPTAKPAAKRATRPVESSSNGEGVVIGPSTRPAAPVRATSDDDDMPARSSSALTEAEIERAAQLEAEVAAKEKAAIAESLRRRNRGQDRGHGALEDVNAPLSVRAAHEYEYVARDVKRITMTAAVMFGILAVLHVLVNVMGVISL